jgi:hypothetical protein
MKKILIITLITLFFVPILFAEKRVPVKGYYRKDGTYVRPHYRSAPDGDKSNNYGRPSYQQRKQYESYPILPTYQYDYDSDGTQNRYDNDDDNDGTDDNYDSNPYSSRSYSRPSYKYPSQRYSNPSYSSLSQSYNDDPDDYDSSSYSIFESGKEDSEDSDSSSGLYDW